METTDDVRKECINQHGSGPETSVTRTPQDCKYFHTCSASLCPLDPDVSLKIWLPEESDIEENMQKHRVRRPAVCDNSEKDPEGTEKQETGKERLFHVRNAEP